ncbi:MAG TPA: hypothetical protein VIL35_17615 [Vicinamibacterales bacterium]
MITRVRLAAAVLGIAAIIVSVQAAARGTAAQAPARSTSVEKKVWYFYTVKWGQQERFLELFRKNHYPVLKAQLGTRLTGIRTYVPTYHGDGRADWTFAVELTFKDAQTQVTPWAEEQETIRKLFPDQKTFQAEERERFDLLVAHWDVPLNEISMEQ